MDTPHPGWVVLRDLVSYIPAIIALALITNDWDSEWLVIACLAMGAGGSKLIERFKLK